MGRLRNANAGHTTCRESHCASRTARPGSGTDETSRKADRVQSAAAAAPCQASLAQVPANQTYEHTKHAELNREVSGLHRDEERSVIQRLLCDERQDMRCPEKDPDDRRILEAARNGPPGQLNERVETGQDEALDKNGQKPQGKARFPEK